MEGRHELMLRIAREWTALLLPVGLLAISYLAMIGKTPWPEDLNPLYVFWGVITTLIGTRLEPLKVPWKNGAG